MFCEDQILLMANYSAAVAAYYSTVVQLEQQIRGSGEIYQQQRRLSEKARMMCEAARKELDQHVTAHGCGRLPLDVPAQDSDWAGLR